MDMDFWLSLLMIAALFAFGTVRPADQQISIRGWFDTHWRRWHALPCGAVLIFIEVWLREFAPETGGPARGLMGTLMTLFVLIGVYRLKETVARVRRD
jgi:hypothetical protein